MDGGHSFFGFNTLCCTGPSSRGEFAKNVVGGAALGLATLFTPTLTRPAAAVTASLDELTANIILAKVRQGRDIISYELRISTFRPSTRVLTYTWPNTGLVRGRALYSHFRSCTRVLVRLQPRMIFNR